MGDSGAVNNPTSQAGVPGSIPKIHPLEDDLLIGEMLHWFHQARPKYLQKVVQSFLCRSEWHKFGRRDNESMEEHAKRLAETFSFKTTDFPTGSVMGGQAKRARRRGSGEAPATPPICMTCFLGVTIHAFFTKEC